MFAEKVESDPEEQGVEKLGAAVQRGYEGGGEGYHRAEGAARKQVLQLTRPRVPAPRRQSRSGTRRRLSPMSPFA